MTSLKAHELLTQPCRLIDQTDSHGIGHHEQAQINRFRFLARDRRRQPQRTQHPLTAIRRCVNDDQDSLHSMSSRLNH